MNNEKPFPFFLAKPAQRALVNAGITSLEQLSKLSDREAFGASWNGPQRIGEDQRSTCLPQS